MDNAKVYFEQVPLEVAKKAEAQESKREWMDIAKDICREQDDARLMELVVELKQALDARGPGK